MKLIQAVFCLICLNLFTISYAVPVVSNLVKPVKYFLDHEREIIDLSNRLELYNVAGLVGFSGMGKTELARKYAYKNQDKYNLIWFFDCNSDLSEQFVSLSKKINNSNLCGSNGCDLSEEHEKAKKAVLEFLSPKSNWLLVFDNLRVNQNSTVADIINWGHNGHLIICSQDSKDLPNSVHLPYLSDNDASNVADTILETKNQETVRELVKIAKGYPILIVQGAMFLNENKHMNVNDYEKIISNSDDKMRSHIEIVLKQLPAGAKDLLYKIAVINNQHFSKSLLQSITAPNSNFIKDLDNIVRFGLINTTYTDKDNQVFEMHDIIKDAILSIIKTKAAKSNLEAVISNFNKLLSKGEDDRSLLISQDKTLKSNIEKLLNNAEKYEVDIYKNMELRKNLISVYLGLFDYYNCQKMTDWLINRQDKFDSLLTSITMSNKGKAIYSEYLAIIGSYEDFAKSDFVSAIKYLEKAAGLVTNNQYPELQLSTYCRLAQTYVYGADIKNTERTIKILDSIVKDNPKVDLELKSLWFTKAKMYLMQGNYAKAQEAMAKYFETSSHLPDDGAYKAPGYILQAEILNYMGKFKEAYDIMEKTYEQQKINIKGEHELHARILVQLAWAELGLGMKQEAFEHIKDSVRIFADNDAIIGDNVSANSYNVDVAAAYAVEGNVLSAIGKDNETIMNSYGKASKIYSNRYSENLFLVYDIKRFYDSAAENLCRISNNKNVMERIMYTEFRDKLVSHWPNDPKTKELLELEKKNNCRILPD